MSHCLANPSFFSIQNTISNFPRSKSFSVKAMANDNLERLQRPITQQNQQPKKRTSAPIGLWDRFPTAKTVQQMMDTMDQMMDTRIREDEPFSYGNNRYATDNVAYSRGRTPWGIMESETEYKLRFDMPGMTKQDVKVWVEEIMLVVKAEKPPRKTNEANGEEWPAKSYGRYNYRIALPENVEVEKIKAEVKDGVLYITTPKSSPTAKILDINVQ